MTDLVRDPEAITRLNQLRSLDEAVALQEEVASLDEDSPYRQTVEQHMQSLVAGWPAMQEAALEIMQMDWGSGARDSSQVDAAAQPILVLANVFPLIFEIRLSLATLGLIVGDNESSADLLESIVDEFPDKKGIREDLGKVLMLLERPSEALVHLKKEVDRGWATWEGYWYLAAARVGVANAAIEARGEEAARAEVKEHLTHGLSAATRALNAAPESERPPIRKQVAEIGQMLQAIAAVTGDEAAEPPPETERAAPAPDVPAAADTPTLEPEDGKPQPPLPPASGSGGSDRFDWPLAKWLGPKPTALTLVLWGVAAALGPILALYFYLDPVNIPPMPRWIAEVLVRLVFMLLIPWGIFTFGYGLRLTSWSLFRLRIRDKVPALSFFWISYYWKRWGPASALVCSGLLYLFYLLVGPPMWAVLLLRMPAWALLGLIGYWIAGKPVAKAVDSSTASPSQASTSTASKTAHCGHPSMVCNACGATGCTKTGCSNTLVDWSQSSACLRCGDAVKGFRRA